VERHYRITGTRFEVMVASDQTSFKKIELFLHQKYMFLLTGQLDTSTRYFMEVMPTYSNNDIHNETQIYLVKNRKLRVVVGDVEKPITVSDSTSHHHSESGNQMARSSNMPRIQPTDHLIFLLSPVHDRTFVISQFSHNILSDVATSGSCSYNFWLQVS
jgi:hypothetical protein